MAKTAGGIRTLRPGSRESRKRSKEVADMVASGKYSSVTMGTGGGYVAVEKSPMRHTKDELDAARILADKGYKVVLKNEAGHGHKVTTPDGELFSITFEQRTPTKDSPGTIRNALNHAKDKGADIALIYSRNHIFSRQSVDEGIKIWETVSDYRFKQIIVVADNGHIHRHRHNL